MSEAKKPQKLTRLRLSMVSLVDEPANPKAEVTFFKRNLGDENDMKKEDVYNSKAAEPDGDEPDGDECPKCGEMMKKGKKYCSNCGANMTEKTSKAADLLDKITDPEVKQAVEKMAAELKAATDLLDERAAVEKKAAKSEDEVLKGLSPEIRERIEKAEAAAKIASEAVEKMRDEQETGEWIQKAAQLTRIKGKAEVLGPILKRMKAEDRDPIFEVLKAANEAAKPLFRVVGKNGQEAPASRSAAERVQSKAGELIAKAKEQGSDMKLGDAISKVLSEDHDLYLEYRAEASVTQSGRVVNGDHDEE